MRRRHLGARRPGDAAVDLGGRGGAGGDGLHGRLLLLQVAAFKAVTIKLLSDGLPMVQVGQTFAMLSDPSKDLEARIAAGKVRHGGHPVLRWMASNCAIAQDPAGNIKPDKSKSSEKIDGIVALVME